LIADKNGLSQNQRGSNMLRAKILRIDGSTLVEDAEVQGQQPRPRRIGEGIVWRGFFNVPSPDLRPTMGETIQLRLEGDSTIPVVVTEIAGSMIHFRGHGTMPGATGAAEAEPTS
jgi:hypothetical protein